MAKVAARDVCTEPVCTHSARLLNVICTPERAARLTGARVLPARTGVAGAWPSWADPALVAGYRALGVQAPWRHQVSAADALWSGRHVALATSTGSGKSLAFWLPVLTAVRAGKARRPKVGEPGKESGRRSAASRRASVLYLSPTKALAADQFAALERVLGAVTEAEASALAAGTLADGGKPIRVLAATCDGDTPTAERKWIQAEADVVLTNPDFLHFSMLPGHRHWSRFLRDLRFVIVDEGHSYRGVFGAHVAGILRRLARLVAYYRPRTPGADAPVTFVVASATSSDPGASAARLIGADTAQVLEITADASPAGERTVALWQPPEVPQLRPGQSGRNEARPTGGTAASAEPASGVTGMALSWDTDPWELPDPFAVATEMDEPPVVLPGVAGGSEGELIAPRRTATAEAAELLAVLTVAGARTLAFTRSRRGAENVATNARDRVRATGPAAFGSRTPAHGETNAGSASDSDPAGGVAGISTPVLVSRHEPTLAVAADSTPPETAFRPTPAAPPQIAAYRGGYLPEERRALEHDLRTGAIRGLATTNALELGMDIAGLDAVLIAGWPGTLMSLWQQAGRAGRAGADGLVVFIAREDPLDTYLITHPEAVFDAPIEATVFDPGNPYVLAAQLCAAAQELPLTNAELGRFGEVAKVRAVLAELVAGGALRRRDSGWYWTHDRSAAHLADLRGAGGPPVRVVEHETGRILGTVDATAADRQVHAGAVYVHQGATFVIAHLDLADAVATAVPTKVDHTTFSREVTSLQISGEPERTLDWGAVRWGFGPIEVSATVVSFERRRLLDQMSLGTEALDLPERTLATTGVWWQVPASLLAEAGLSEAQVPGALHAAEHASIGMLPLLATCDRWDLGGVSTDLHPDTGEATVFVYDAFPGGAGFAERGFELAERWLSATLAAIQDCPCELGCPACIQSPKCGNNNSPLDKAGAIRLLRTVLAARRAQLSPAD